MVGGGAVNFHGYQRHSADVDFWIDATEVNFKALVQVFNGMGYEIQDLPESVKKQEQNISVKFSPTDLNLELITSFPIGLSFEEAYQQAETVILDKEKKLIWKVLSLNHLIDSKLKSGRPKDLLDIQELKRINNID